MEIVGSSVGIITCYLENALSIYFLWTNYLAMRSIHCGNYPFENGIFNKHLEYLSGKFSFKS